MSTVVEIETAMQDYQAGRIKPLDEIIGAHDEYERLLQGT